MLDYPRRKLVQWLGDIRRLGRLPESARDPRTTDAPTSILRDPDSAPLLAAITHLDDAQFAEAAAGKPVTLPWSLFPEEKERYETRWRNTAERRRENARKAGDPDPFPDGVPEPPRTQPTFRVRWFNAEGGQPWREGHYSLSLSPILDFEIVWKPLARIETRIPEDEGPVVDLTPLLTGSGVTPEQRGDVGFTIQALARTARLPVYAEYFYKPAYPYGGRSNGIRIFKGPVGRIIQAICREWEYYAEKIDGVYYFWPASWAQDRRNDIPESYLDRWRQRIRERGRLSLPDRAEIAARLTDGQLRQTFRLAIPEAGRWPADQIPTLRLYGKLSHLEQQAALSRSGLPVPRLLPEVRQLVAATVAKEAGAVDTAEWATARLILRKLPERGQPGRREEALALTVVSPQRKLLSRELHESE